MAFPVLINNSTTSLPGATGHTGEFIAPNGALYAIAYVGSSNLRCYKSVDGGTTWSEQDASNAPTSSGIGNVAISLAILCTLVLDISGHFSQVFEFDTSTDLWGGNVVTTNVYEPPFNTHVPDLNVTNTIPMLGRSDGTVVIGGVYYDLIGTGLSQYVWYRGQYFIYTLGGTYTTWTPCGVTSSTQNCTLDQIVAGSGMSHFIFSQWDANSNNFGPDISGTFQSLLQQPFDNSNTLGSIQTIKTIGPQPNPVENSIAANYHNAFGDGTTVIIAWTTAISSPFTALEIFVGASASTISFTETDVTIPGFDPGSNAWDLSCLVSPGGLFVFVLGESTLSYYLDSGSGFGTNITVGSWDAGSSTAIWLPAPYITWGVDANTFMGAQFWRGGGTTRKNNYISNGPRLMTLGPFIA